jgi:hypothetical protein
MNPLDWGVNVPNRLETYRPAGAGRRREERHVESNARPGE